MQSWLQFNSCVGVMTLSSLMTLMSACELLSPSPRPLAANYSITANGMGGHHHQSRCCCRLRHHKYSTACGTVQHRAAQAVAAAAVDVSKRPNVQVTNHWSYRSPEYDVIAALRRPVLLPVHVQDVAAELSNRRPGTTQSSYGI